MKVRETGWVVSLDPGLRGCGIAVFEHRILYRAWYVRSPNKRDRGAEAWYDMAERVQSEWLERIPSRLSAVDTLVLEVPQVYWGAKRGGNPSDLIQLAGVVGAVSFGIPAFKKPCFLPREWKGQTPKDVHNKRVLAELGALEVESIEPCGKTLLHNVLDAVGLGLFHLKRIG